ncbi:MAG: TIGR03084 family protein, partial [Aldersonia sp.]|nr:TIGR03084 family protein [Aldersonia sp.]
DDGARAWAAEPAPQLLETWRAGRARLVEALAGVEPGRKLDWFGPPMSAASMATARLMETWAHGQDIADALGATRVATHRLRHVAHLGVRTRNFAFGLHELPPPAEEFRVELRAPGGETWTWGPEDAAQRVTGSALDFCLLVTQRRHLDDLDVTATGGDAQKWIAIAQAFAGPPGPGREAGQFQHTGKAS